MGLNDGTIVAALLAARHPELCRALVLFPFTKIHQLEGGIPMGSIDEVIELIEAVAPTDDVGMEILAPSRVGDDRFSGQLARLRRNAVRPGVMGHYYR